jgi:plastocyanin
MRDRTRDRVFLPIAMPIGILIVLAFALYGFSRILLSLPANAATAIALVVAIAILIVCGIAANRSVVRSAVLASILGAVVGVAMLAGGVALIATAGTGEEGGDHGGPPPGGGVTVVAQDLAFDTTEIHLVAGHETALTFDNRDPGQQHNIAIFPSEDELSDVLFRGDIITGPDTITYTIPALEPGTYYFHCDVHPQMSGAVVVEEAPALGGGGGEPGGGGGQPGGGAGITLTAQNLAFDTDTIDLPAGQPSTITFHNEDPAQQHNIAIYASADDLSEPLFRGDIITGPDTVTYEIPALEPGEYYFQCDVHPAMNGTVTVG